MLTTQCLHAHIAMMLFDNGEEYHDDDDDDDISTVPRGNGL